MLHSTYVMQPLPWFFTCSSGDYWIGLAQVDSNHVYWINGTQYTGQPISGQGTSCIEARIAEGGIELAALACNNTNKYICEDVAPPGK